MTEGMVQYDGEDDADEEIMARHSGFLARHRHSERSEESTGISWILRQAQDDGGQSSSGQRGIKKATATLAIQQRPQWLNI